MKNFLADLHIHIGSAGAGKPVKITASRKLNMANIARESLIHKGLNMIGIVDCASPPVIEDIEKLISSGQMKELPDGGLLYKDKLVIIPGAEVESSEKNGQAHYLAFFPGLTGIKEYSYILNQYIKNINLSSQQTGLNGAQLLQIVDNLGGIFIPAHIFTPYKSFFGRCYSSYREIFSDEEWDKIPAIELGLSADTYLADYLSELEEKTFLSNSDAHSINKIAREYNLLHLKELNFNELKLALEKKNGRKILKNFGLDPALGKYHRSFCPICEKTFEKNYAVYTCPDCGHDELIVGVKDRILKIADKEKSTSPRERAQYIYQVPLLDIPGVGKKTLKKLLKKFGTEMNIIHKVPKNELRKYVHKEILNSILKMRAGNLKIKTGGGGKYGKVVG